MDAVIRYDKSLYQRKEEYIEIFKEDHQWLRFSDLQNKWSDYLSSTIDHSGWQAIWKIERFTCEILKIGHPSYALVYVKSINFDTLIANVLILMVETNVKVEENQIVPLIDLWPTKIQDKSIVLDMDNTSNALDVCRFFHKEILMPWDYFSNDEQWIENKLLDRLHLYHDIKHGKVPSDVKDEIASIRSKAKRLYYKMEVINDCTKNEQMDTEDDLPSESSVETVDILVQLKRLKTTYKFLENHSTSLTFRKDFLIDEKCPQKYYLIINEQNITKVLEVIASLQGLEELKDLKITFVSNFSDIIKYQGNDVIFLHNSKYFIQDLSNLTHGGTLKGVFKNQKAQLHYKNDEIILSTSGNVLLENLQINSENAQCTILINKGMVTMKNCTILGNPIHQGIVLNSAKLHMIDCTLRSFNVAITANNESSIHLTNVQVHEANVGLKISPDVSVVLENCAISNCNDYGMMVIQKNDVDEIVGEFSLLQK